MPVGVEDPQFRAVTSQHRAGARQSVSLGNEISGVGHLLAMNSLEKIDSGADWPHALRSSERDVSSLPEAANRIERVRVPGGVDSLQRRFRFGVRDVRR